MQNKTIWNALLKAEQKARTSKLKRLLDSPIRYPLLMGFNKIAYPVFNKGIMITARPFFGVRMKTLLPSGTDILLNGIKSHDSEIRLAKFITLTLVEGDTFIDVGAHYGYYALLSSALTGPSGCVYAIEASGNSYDILRKNTVSVKNIKVFHNAAGEVPGEIIFYEYPGPFAEYNTIVKGAYEAKSWLKKVKQTINRVQTIVLDDLISAHQIKKAIIKIDVEGGEFSVIKGLTSSLQHTELTIVMEYLISEDHESPHHQAVSLLTLNGYNAHAIDREGNLMKVEVIDQYLRDAGLDSDNLVFLKG